MTSPISLQMEKRRNHCKNGPPNSGDLATDYLGDDYLGDIERDGKIVHPNRAADEAIAVRSELDFMRGPQAACSALVRLMCIELSSAQSRSFAFGNAITSGAARAAPRA